MNAQPPRTTREALIAEMLGDLQTAISRCDAAIAAAAALDQRLGASASALTQAANAYRTQIDDLAARLRVETAAMLKTTTEHAANAVVGKQSNALQHAATNAIRQAIREDLGRRLRRYFSLAVVVSGMLSALIVILAMRLSL